MSWIFKQGEKNLPEMEKELETKGKHGEYNWFKSQFDISTPPAPFRCPGKKVP